MSSCCRHGYYSTAQAELAGELESLLHVLNEDVTDTETATELSKKQEVESPKKIRIPRSALETDLRGELSLVRAGFKGRYAPRPKRRKTEIWR